MWLNIDFININHILIYFGLDKIFLQMLKCGKIKIINDFVLQKAAFVNS